MEETQVSTTTLGDLRVLDLAGEIGIYCAKILADLGADVIRIEPPQGHPSRLQGPFYHDEPHPEKSLYHFLMNTNKRGITLSLERTDGRELFRKLVARADVVVETFPPGYLEDRGLGFNDLERINPRLIMTSITPFGQTGPFRHFKATNIVGDASGGLMYITGSPEEPPLMSAAEQGYYMAAIQGAVGTLMALYHRDETGEGQHVDVSMQEAVAMTVQPQAMFWPGKREVARRFGYGQRTRNVAIYASSFYPCKDGWITGLGAQSRNWGEMVAWLEEEGAAEDLGDPKYQEEGERAKNAAHVQETLARFAAQRTMDQLTEGGQRHRLFVFPVYTAREVVNDVHLKERNFFVTLEHPELGEALTYPGAPFRLTETPWRLTRRAPLLGEHNLEVYQGELGIAQERLARLKSVGAI